MRRRQFITTGAAILAHCLVLPRTPWASQFLERNHHAFDARSPDSLYAALGIHPPVECQDILIEAPDVAENGIKVPVEVRVDLPQVERILIIGESNRYPLLADVWLSPIPFNGT